MSGDGRWFVLFPASRTPRVEDAERVLRELASARVANHGKGAFGITFRERPLAVGLETKDDVLVESGELVGRLGQLDDGGRAYLAKCDHRYSFSYDLSHGGDLLDALVSASAKLRGLTGGMVIDAAALRVVEPPLDPSALKDDPKIAIAKSLQVLADGGWAPRDLTLQHYATSAHVTIVTSTSVSGDAEVDSVTGDRPTKRGTASIEAIRAAARAIVESGYPDIRVPKGSPIPPPTVPPVSIVVKRGGEALSAEVSAAQLDLVPKFYAAVHAVSGLGAGALKGAENAKAALEKLAEGAPAGPLTIESTFVADAERRFRLRLENNGSIVEEELLGAQAKQATLGASLPEERKAIGRAILDASFPDAHGKTVPVKGPHYVFRVAHALDSVEVIVDAEKMEERGLDKAIRAIYSAAARFGVRPLTLKDGAAAPAQAAQATQAAPGLLAHAMDIGMLFANNRENVADVQLLMLDDSISAGWYASRISLGAEVTIILSHHPGTGGPHKQDMALDLSKVAGMRVLLSDGGEKSFGRAPPARKSAAPASAPPAIAPQLLDFVNKRITFATLARWLAEHKQLWVPAAQVEGGGYMPRIDRASGAAAIAVCTSEATLEQWFARFGGGQQRVAMNDTWGAGLFGGMPDFITRVDIDPASPLTLQIHGEPLTALRAVSRAVNVERAIATPDDPASARLVLDHTFRVAWRQGAINPAAGGPQNALLVALPGPRGEMLAAAFTADDCADAYFMSAGGGRSGITMGSMTGRDLFASLGFLRVEGVSFNPSGPGPAAILTKDVCARVAATR